MIRQLRSSLVWYAFIAPTFLLFGLFVVYPTFETFRLSFFREVATRQEFVGATHYIRLLTSQLFFGALLNTAALGVVFLAITIPLALVMASLLNNLRVAPKFFKAVYFLAAGDIDRGRRADLRLCVPAELGAGQRRAAQPGRDRAAALAGRPAPQPDRLARRRHAAGGLGGAGLLYAGVPGRPPVHPAQLYDAAVVDGAGSLQSWWYITIPSLRPTFVFLFLTGTIDAMSRFSDTWMLGGPGGTPARSLQTIVMYIYQTAFESSDFNLASAAAVAAVSDRARAHADQLPALPAARFRAALSGL